MATFNEIIKQFKVIRRKSDSVQCICPTHYDKNASLTISLSKDKDGNEKTILYCHAGCEAEDILKSKGLKISDLYTNQYTRECTGKSGLEKCIEYYESKGNKYISDYTYKDENGNYLYTKIKLINQEGKKSFIYVRVSKNKWKAGRGDIDPVPYRLDKIVANRNKYPIYIVEGEKDVHTMEEIGFLATTTGGAGTWKDEYKAYFKGASIVILPDNDESGNKYAREIKKSIKKIAYRLKVVTISPDEKGDITDFINKGNSKDDVKRVLSDQDWNYANWVRLSTSNAPKGIDQYALSVVINSFIDYIVMDTSEKNKSCIYVYDNGVYININKNPFISKHIKPFLPNEYKTTNNFDEVYKQLCIMDERFKTPTDFDQNPYIINVKNGLFDIKDFTLKAHDPSYLSLKQLNVNFNTEPTDHGYFNGFIDKLTDGDADLMSVIVEYMGITFSNIPTHYTKKLLMLQGKGDTGKSQLIKITNEIMGADNIKAMPPQKLADRFTMSACHDKGLVFCADAPSDALKDLSVIKSMTGGDTLSAENKGGAYYDVTFNGSIVIACNDKPRLDGDNGKHMYDRVLLIPCNNVIPKHEQDPGLFEKLKEDDEYIFYIAMCHLKRLIDNEYKFTRSDKIEKELNEYMIQDDDVLQWLHSEYVEVNQEAKTKSRDLYRSYKLWCDNQGIKDYNKAINLSNRLKQLGYENGKRGNSVFYALKITEH